MALDFIHFNFPYFFYLKFNSEGKKKLVMALRDGFKIPLN